MHTVDTLLDSVKKAHGISSDYKLAQFLKVTQHTIANYRHGRSRPDDITLTRLADLGGVDPVEVDILAAQLQADRATNEAAKHLWNRIAKRLQQGMLHCTMLVVVAMLSLASYSPNAEATAFSPASSAPLSVYYVKLFLRLARRATLRLQSLLVVRMAGRLFSVTFASQKRGPYCVQSAHSNALAGCPA